MTTPTSMPVLSPGRHFSPRFGACFMEYASVLAGVRWSDHPSCTDPALAHLARAVNDVMPDDRRSELAPLIPSVVGLVPAHPLSGIAVAVLSASAAIPVSAELHQRSLACGLITARAQIAAYREQHDDAVAAQLDARAQAALAAAPQAARWALEFRRRFRIERLGDSPSTFRRTATMIETGVIGLADACIDDTSGRLHRLLSDAIEFLRGIDGPAEEAVDAVNTAGTRSDTGAATAAPVLAPR